jgi:GT2 family glycosyltransferase
VDSAGDSYSLSGWPTKRGHGQPASRWAGRQVEEVFAASGSSSFFRAEAVRQVGGFDPYYVSYYEDVDLSFRLRWAGYRCVFAPRCRILHEISATNDHTRPNLQRQIARNAELVFWSNMPARRMPAAIVAHLGLIVAQAGWRMLRLRFLPFFLGKLDAIRSLPTIRQRRKLRADLARSSIAPPNFPLRTASLGTVIDHLRRPRRTPVAPGPSSES